MTNAVANSTTPLSTHSPPRIDTGRVTDLIRQLLVELGEDTTRAGLTSTPERFLTIAAAQWGPM